MREAAGKVKEKINWTALAALGGSAVGTYGALKALAEIPPWAVDLIKTQGSDFMVAAVGVFVVLNYGPKFIRSQQDQAVALSSLAESVKNLPQRDELKFDSIILGQEALHREIRNVFNRFEKMEGRLDRIEGKIDGPSE